MVEQTPDRKPRISREERNAAIVQSFNELFSRLEEDNSPSDRESIYWIQTGPKRGRSGKAIVYFDERSNDPYAKSVYIWPQLANGLMVDTVLEMEQMVNPNPDDDYDFSYKLPEFRLKQLLNTPPQDLDEVDVEDAISEFVGDQPSNVMHVFSLVDPIEAQQFTGKIDVDSLRKYF